MHRNLLLILIIFPFIVSSVNAQDGGVTDRDLNASTSTSDSSGTNGYCGIGTNCHNSISTGATISISAQPGGPYTAGQTNILINVTTNIPAFTKTGTILGIELVNNSYPGGNIKNDGWVITKDANNNITSPSNYNQKTGLSSLSQTLFWNITAPSNAGTYYIVSRARYGTTTRTVYYNVTSSALTMTIIPNPAPNITSWGNNYTNNNTLSFNPQVSTSVNFNLTANQTVTYNWTYDGTDQGQNFNNFTKQFTGTGLHYVNATISNSNGTDYKNWTVNVNAVTLSPPNITSWGNNYTNNNTLSFNPLLSTSVNFNVTANQTVTYNWTYDGTDQGQNFNNFTKQFTETGLHYVNATISNSNGTDYKNWSVNVISETIDVTLSNINVNFGDVSSGSSYQPASLPLNVTIESTTNVNVNLTLNGSDFVYGIYSFGAGNLTYSNSSNGVKTSVTDSFPLPPYTDWIDIAKQVTSNRSIYFWINIPAGQESGAYTGNLCIRAEKYI